MQTARVKRSGAEDENGGVDEERESESEGGIEDGVAERFAALAAFGAKRACLYEARVEIEIVRHDGGAENADGDVEHFAIANDLRAGNEAVRGFHPQRT